MVRQLIFSDLVLIFDAVFKNSHAIIYQYICIVHRLFFIPLYCMKVDFIFNRFQNLKTSFENFKQIIMVSYRALLVQRLSIPRPILIFLTFVTGKGGGYIRSSHSTVESSLSVC